MNRLQQKLAGNSQVRRLLVITYHFPPDGAIGGQRWAGLSKYLARLGWEVHIVTAAHAGQEQSTPNVHRHFRRRRRTLNDLYRAVAGRGRQRSTAHHSLIREDPGLLPSFDWARPLGAARRFLATAMSLPDEGRGWVAAAAVGARGLLRQQAFDVVISSGPPHSAHFAGLAATLGRDTPFWMDMRDPWSVRPQFGPHGEDLNRGERFILGQLARLVLPRAARVIVNTLQFQRELGVSEPALEVTCLPNGVDLEHLPARNAAEVKPGSIAYVGNLYTGRSLTAVCAAMRRILDDKPEAAATLRLDVAGPMDDPHRRKFQYDIEAAGLTSVVHIHGSLPRAQALQLLRRSHLALVLAQDQPMQVPAKLYETVGLGVPTLVIAEDTSAAACEARRVGAMTVDNADVDGLQSVFEKLLGGDIPTTLQSKTPITYAHLAKQLDGLLRESLNADGQIQQRKAAAVPGL